MIAKGHKLYSILTGSCPKCHAESMYKKSNPYNITAVYDMHEHCSVCHTKYKIEPSFFYGAMYVSYGLGVAVAVAAFIISFVFLNSSMATAFFSIMGALILLMPLNMRLARNIWISFFISYDPEAASNAQQSA